MVLTLDTVAIAGAIGTSALGAASWLVQHSIGKAAKAAEKEREDRDRKMQAVTDGQASINATLVQLDRKLDAHYADWKSATQTLVSRVDAHDRKHEQHRLSIAGIGGRVGAVETQSAVLADRIGARTPIAGQARVEGQ